MDVVCFGQQNWDYCWTGKQQLLTRMARRGHRILYVDPKWDRPAGAFPKGRRDGLREEGPGELYVHTYRPAPWLRFRGNLWWWRSEVRAAARALGFRNPVVLSLRPQANALALGLAPRALLYYQVDEITAYGQMSEEGRARVRRQEDELLRRADLALAVSRRLQKRLMTVHPMTYHLPNGVDAAHFSPENLDRAPLHAALEKTPSPRLGFVGQIDERLDQDLLAGLAVARPQWQFVLAGRVRPGVDVSPISSLPNVRLLGYQDYRLLPGILRGIDVCLAPYRRSELTESCHPLKVMEYLATGLPVVATDLESLSDQEGLVELASGREAWIAAIERALQDPGRGRERRLSYAAENSWDRRVDELEERIEQAIDIARRRREVAPKGFKLGRRAGSHDAVRLGARGGLLFAGTWLAGSIYYGFRVAFRLIRRERPVIVRKILVARRLTRLGDSILLIPALSALRRAYPNARIVLGVDSSFPRDILPAGLTDEVRVLDPLIKGTRLERAKGIFSLFREGFDLVISGRKYFVVRESFYSGAPWRAGIDDGHPLQKLNNIRVPFDAVHHEAENNLAVAEALGARVATDDRVPLVAAPPASGQEAAVERLGVPGGATVAVFHPGSKRRSRRWPPERFSVLADRLLARRPHLWIVFTGTPGEIPVIEEIVAGVSPQRRPRTVVAAGRTGLDGLVALLAASAAVVCNDTGTLHLARAVGAPLVALLGPENDLSWGPHPAGKAPAIAFRNPVPCAPCLRMECEALYCLRTLSLDAVQAAVETFLDRTAGAGPAPTDGGEDARAFRAALEPASSGWFPVTRVGRPLDWSSLSEMGFELPPVSIVVFPGSVLRSRRARSPRRAGSERPSLELALSEVARQRYPQLEVIVLREAGDESEPAAIARSAGWGGPIRTIPLGASGFVPDVWRSILAVGSGRFFALLSDAFEWSPDKIDADVAALVRWPEAEAVHHRSPLLRRPREALLGTITLRRDAIASFLERAPGVSDLLAQPAGGLELVVRSLRDATVAHVEEPRARPRTSPPPRDGSAWGPHRGRRSRVLEKA